MEINIYNNKKDAGAGAAEFIASVIDETIRRKGEAAIIVATGAGQFEMLENLVQKDLDWSKVTVFQLKEYIGLPAGHPSTIRRYLEEYLEEKVGPFKAFYYLNGEAPDPAGECKRIGEIIEKVRIDIACIGMGENGYIAFNNPPADFETKEPYIVVELDDDCRRQQYEEGWFETIEAVPKQAVSMSVHQVMKSDVIACVVPDKRKAKAVQKTVEGRANIKMPASILKRHKHCALFIDRPAASQFRLFK